MPDPEELFSNLVFPKVILFTRYLKTNFNYLRNIFSNIPCNLKIGNVFTPQLIDIVVQNGEKYKDLPINQYALHSLGVDGGFGSSNTALVLCELLKDEHKIRVIYSREYEKGNPSFIADKVYELYQKYNNLWIWIDGCNRAFVNELKVRFGEDPNYEKVEDVSMDSNRVIPVNFNTDHKPMLSHLYNIVNKQYLAIPELYDRLIISLRTATAKELTLDKDDSSYNDSFDALRLACKGFQISSSYGLGY